MKSFSKEMICNHFAGDFLSFYRQFIPNIKPGNNGTAQAACPFHDDHNPSMSISKKDGLFHCHACGEQGSLFDFFARKNNLDARKDFNKVIMGIAEQFGISETERPAKTPAKVVARYDYQTTDESLAYQIERLQPKSFRIRRPDGDSWAYNRQGLELIPYRLPDILKADEIIIVEGEKDVDNLHALGFVATCNPFGAGKWPEDFGKYFTGKSVIIIPDNDSAGRDHARKVSANIKGKARSLKLLELPGLPEKGDISDLIAQIGDADAAAERLAILIDGAPEYLDQQPEQPKPEAPAIQVINAADWLKLEPAKPDQILDDTFDLGDKVAIIGSSKMRKSFFLLQMLISIAAGRSFLAWDIPKPRRVLHVQLEIQPRHYHARIIRMARALGIGPENLGDRLQIINGRGLGLAGEKGINQIRDIAKEIKPEIISLDPLYKIATGIENAAEDLKVILSIFDALAEETGAAIAYVHHDAKGAPGDRDIRDRGAGSNVLGRDYDACITLTPHASEEEAAVVDVLLRNYRPQEPFSIRWTDDESGGYRFETAGDLTAEKRTSKTKKATTPLSDYLPIAGEIMGGEEMGIALFKNILKQKTGLSDHKIRSFIKWATDPENGFLLTREERSFGKNNKWLKIGRDYE